MSEVSENSEKPSRGEAAPGLSAQLPNDIEIGPILVPTWLQKWSQNGVGKGLKFALVFGLLFGPKLDPKWSQKGSKIGPNMGSAAQMCSWSPKWAPKWTQSGSGSPKMDPKWLQNGSQMAPKCDIRIRLATDPWHVAGPGGMRVALTIMSGNGPLHIQQGPKTTKSSN